MQPLKTLKPFELTWPPRKQPSNFWLCLVRLQRTLRIFCYQKTLWLGNPLPSVSVLTRQYWYVIEDNRDTQRMQLHVMSVEVKELPRVGGGVVASTWERPGCSSSHLMYCFGLCVKKYLYKENKVVGGSMVSSRGQIKSEPCTDWSSLLVQF